jgi:hypothetical protein
MIKILYNPDHPELIFAAAVVLLNIGETYPDEAYCLIPMPARDLNKEEHSITDQLAKDMSVVMKADCSYMFEPEGVDHYVLLGIHPENQEDERKIYNFFEKKEKNLYLWVDGHDWPENLSDFLQSQSEVIHLIPGVTCLQILGKNSYEIFPGAIAAEKATVKLDMRNPLASRYLKIFLSNRSLGINMNMLESFAYFAFMASVDEIVENKENTGLSLMADAAYTMIEEADKIRENFVDDLPEFKKAKEMGRPVGCLLLGKVTESFCIEEVMEYGIQKYPWLCVVGFFIDDVYLFHFASEKIPITEIVKSYSPDIQSREEFFKILNSEIVRVSTA